MKSRKGKVEVAVEMDGALCGKLRKVCKERGLRFPADLSLLLKEVCTPVVVSK